jgi:hypothetical protein
MGIVHAHVEHHEKDREQRDGFDDGFEHEQKFGWESGRRS